MVAIFPAIKVLYYCSKELKVKKYLSIHFETFLNLLISFKVADFDALTKVFSLLDL